MIRERKLKNNKGLNSICIWNNKCVTLAMLLKNHDFHNFQNLILILRK